MMRVVPIFFAALFTVTIAWSLGMLLFRKLTLVLHTWEERLLAFVCGSACLSALMFVLSATRLVYRGVLLALGLAIIAYAAYSGVFRSAGKPFPPLPRLWLLVFVAGFAAYTYVGFFNALAPEHSPDGMSYHLSEVLKYQQAHGFPLITNDIYFNLSQGIELLYLLAFNFGRHSAATLVHFTFLVALVFLILSYGRRIGRPAAGVAAAIFTYASPIVLLDGSIAYIDVALAAVLFGLFYLLQIWDENRDPKMLIPIGILTGFGYAVKYTAFLAVPYAVGFIAWKLWRRRQPVLRPALVVSLLAAAFILPWMVKDWIEVANPVSPLANRLFPNPYVHISFEDTWRHDLANYNLTSHWQIPLQITVEGDHVEGFLGPLFLLTPLALLALRFREGRQLLLAAVLFGLPYIGNIGTRFLIPIVPFVALSIALAVTNLPWLLLVLVAAHAVTCWPRLYHYYSSPSAFRIERVPVKAALRRIPENAYLSDDPEYETVRMIGSIVPRGQPILAINPGGQSYLQRDLLTGYASASNEVLQDILWTPVMRSFQPTRLFKFEFPPRELRKLRVLQTANLPDNQWSMAELRVYRAAPENATTELQRDPAWRLTARPNPWDVQMAFDNSPVTRWRSWEPAAPGMYVEIDFGRAEQVGAVEVVSSEDSGDVKLKLEGMDVSGSWATLSNRPVEARNFIRASLRLAASAELKARGIHYVLIKPEDPGADDFRRYTAAWGMTWTGSVGDVRLYQIK
ncbi:MAG: glycosyltransferase family 39 protein [Bryobacterales bacterium]|nr:glycosyltransferase family 39 protein [Bryobacterales bacterium]